MKTLFFFLLFLLSTEIFSVETLPCPSSLEKTVQCTSCTVDEWYKKILALKERPAEFSTLPAAKEYQKNILSLPVFMKALHEAADTFACKCGVDNQWLEKQSLNNEMPTLFKLDRPFIKPVHSVKNFPFRPYAEKLVVPPGSEIAVFGDLHGSIHSFMRDLMKLRKEGLLENDFKILKKNFYILLLGDYIDRGIYGVEVMYTIARLVKANPDNVLIARGNHEDYILAPDFRKKHTSREQKDNAPSFIDELYKKFDMTEADEVTIFRFYETLPIVIYLGCGSKNQTHFIQCCHGGLELGYNPRDLLLSDKTIRFERIKQFNRKSEFQKLSEKSQNTIKQAFDLDTLCCEIQDFIPQAPFYAIPGTKHTTYVGQMWNDFYTDPLKSVGKRGKKFTGWVYGKDLTKEVLSLAGSKKAQLKGIFRAHQHNNQTGGPMLNKLCCSKGMANAWNDGMVFTFLSAPDSKLEDTGEACFTYDAFVMITTADQFTRWKMVQYTQDIGMPVKSWITKRRFFKEQDKPTAPLKTKRTFSQTVQI